ncbi:MAG: polysaccharide deacetylase family protein [Clostridia bacterium]|nr:polysaccharide deacetylase family protein [Clostridia bacterium]
MRLLSVFASFIAALVTVLLIFGCYKEQTALNNTGGMEDVRERTAAYRTEVEALQNRLEQLNQQKAEAEARLTTLLNRENYKTEPTAFLSFDGGFSANTLEIIKVLDQHGLKGTFFVIGENIEKSDTLKAEMKKAAQNGHRIGIRSYKNSVSTMYESVDAYFEDLYKCRDLLKEILGEAPVLVRMPGGTGTADIRFTKNTGNENAISEVLDRMEKEGFVVNDWSVNSQDTVSGLSVDDAVSQTLSSSKKCLSATYKTNVLLFTDEKKTYRMLPDVIKGLQDQGFTFATLPTAMFIKRQR